MHRPSLEYALTMSLLSFIAGRVHPRFRRNCYRRRSSETCSIVLRSTALARPHPPQVRKAATATLKPPTAIGSYEPLRLGLGAGAGADSVAPATRLRPTGRRLPCGSTRRPTRPRQRLRSDPSAGRRCHARCRLRRPRMWLRGSSELASTRRPAAVRRRISRCARGAATGPRATFLRRRQ